MSYLIYSTSLCITLLPFYLTFHPSLETNLGLITLSFDSNLADRVAAMAAIVALDGTSGGKLAFMKPMTQKDITLTRSFLSICKSAAGVTAVDAAAGGEAAGKLHVFISFTK